MIGEEDIARMIIYDYDLHTHSSDKMMEYISGAFKLKYTLDKKIQNLFNMDVNIIQLFDYLHNLDDVTSYKKDDISEKFKPVSSKLNVLLSCSIDHW